MSWWALLGTIALCLAVQAFFAASEIALVAADRVKVRAANERGDRSARALAGLLERRDRIVALMLTGSNLATVIAAVTLTSFLHSIKPSISFWAPFILAPLSLLLGESAPKMLALRTPLRIGASARSRNRARP
jgi:putative hemolysin